MSTAFSSCFASWRRNPRTQSWENRVCPFSSHADSASNRGAQGFTVYVATGASPDSYKAAQAISRTMGASGSDSRGIREGDYRALVQTTCRAVLVELGYLSNAADARHLQDGAFQNRLAQALADGITACVR